MMNILNLVGWLKGTRRLRLTVTSRKRELWGLGRRCVIWKFRKIVPERGIRNISIAREKVKFVNEAGGSQ
jgi:hypothetical protein